MLNQNYNSSDYSPNTYKNYTFSKFLVKTALVVSAIIYLWLRFENWIVFIGGTISVFGVTKVIGSISKVVSPLIGRLRK